jgi:sulfur carrier protein ThiS
MKFFIEKENVTKEIRLNKEITIKEFLKTQNIAVESVIVQKNKQISLEDTLICDTDELRILSVVSGG